MNSTFFRASGTLGLMALLFWGNQGPAWQDPKNQRTQEGVEVLARGPIHEAFAQPVMRRQGAGQVIARQPPEAIKELPPDQKPAGENVVWIPGYWAWDEDGEKFLWVSGTWRAAPPGHSWVAGYWTGTEGGWYWVSGYWASAEDSALTLYPTPPDPIEESPPPASGPDETFVPGCWIHYQGEYRWRPGFWLANRPGWVWVPAGYFWTPGGYAFVDGYWDYPFERRGLLFAPAYLDPLYYGRTNWAYRPGYAIAANFLLRGLFVNTGWNHYYFGDYYDPYYGRLGYQPWMDFRIGSRFYDPLYSYYRWNYRNDPRWVEDLRAVYLGRQAGTLARPPRTLQQQITVAATSPQLAVVTPLEQMAAKANIQLKPVANIKDVVKTGEQFQNLRLQRHKLETKLANDRTNPVTSGAPVKRDLARTKIAGKTQVTEKVPPQPALPKPLPQEKVKPLIPPPEKVKPSVKPPEKIKLPEKVKPPEKTKPTDKKDISPPTKKVEPPTPPKQPPPPPKVKPPEPKKEHPPSKPEPRKEKGKPPPKQEQEVHLKVKITSTPIICEGSLLLSTPRNSLIRVAVLE